MLWKHESIGCVCLELNTFFSSMTMTMDIFSAFGPFHRTLISFFLSAYIAILHVAALHVRMILYIWLAVTACHS